MYVLARYLQFSFEKLEKKVSLVETQRVHVDDTFISCRTCSVAWEADCGGCGWKSSLRTLEEAAEDAHAARPSSDPVHNQPSMEVMVCVLRSSPTNVSPSRFCF